MNREWTAKWIGPQEEDKFNPVIYKDFFVDDEVKKATLFIASIGLFEAYINGTRIGNEYLTPYKQDPEKGVQYFEFDITEELNYGADSEANSLDVFLGKDWDEEEDKRFALKAEIVIEVADMEEETEYLSMEFDEILVKPGKFSEEPKKKENLEEIIDLDDLFDEEDMDDLLDGIIENEKVDEIENITEEAEVLLDYVAEEESLDNLFTDDLFNEFVDEIIEEKKANGEEVIENVAEAEELLEEAESFAEETVEEKAEVFEDLDLSAQLISKAGFTEMAEESADEFAEEGIEDAEEIVAKDFEEVVEEEFEEAEEVVEETDELSEEELVEEVPAEEMAEAFDEELADEDFEELFDDFDDEFEETEEVVEEFVEETEEDFEEDFEEETGEIETEEAEEIIEEVEEVDFEEDFDDFLDDEELDEILAEAADETEEFPEEAEELVEEAEEEIAEAAEAVEEELEETVEEVKEEFEETEEAVEEEIEETVEEAEEEIAEAAETVEEEIEEAAEEIEEEIAEATEAVEEELEETAEESLTGLEAAAGGLGVAALDGVAGLAGSETEETEAAEETFEEELPANVIVIATDETWGYYASDIETCGFGKGEVFNRLLWAEQDNPDKDVEVLDLDIPLVEHYAEPITVLEELKAEEVVKNAAGEEFLDFGKPFTGYVSFTSNLPEGTKVVLDFVNNPEEEVEQPEFTYITDGVPEVVRAHFAYFKGRYVKVSGWDGELNPEDFTAFVLLPEELEEAEEPEEVLEEIIEEEPEAAEESLQAGFIETSDENLNRLFDNIFTRQEKVFADDEESETAGEIIDKFAAAACYNMDVKEGIETLLADQEGKCLVTVPWTLYNMYGDKEGLEKFYDGMKNYVEERAEGLDGFLKESEEFIPYDEASDSAFIASANFFEAADIAKKAAKALEKEEDAEKFAKLAEDVKAALLDEFYTPSGRTFLYTQEELITALRTGIYNNKERLVKELKASFKEECYQITCGAEEIPSLCKTLADNGLEDLAYRLLLEINNYGWLYGVEESDTAIWTSADAIAEDGTVDKEILEADDSLEYGAVAEFLYANVLGIKPLEPGFKKIELAPMPNSNLIYANGDYQSPVGRIVSGWEVLEDGKIQIHFEIPEGAEAKVILPACDDETIAVQELNGGEYDFEYMPTRDFIHLFNENSVIGDLLKYQEAMDIVEEISPELAETLQNSDLGVLAESVDFIDNLESDAEKATEIKEKIYQLI